MARISRSVAAASETGEAASVGSDILSQAGIVVLDFRKMQISAQP
jgi:hypothetical protein